MRGGSDSFTDTSRKYLVSTHLVPGTGVARQLDIMPARDQEKMPSSLADPKPWKISTFLENRHDGQL